ncbi:MAG: hypothetical protein KDK53_11495 [Maritimibacter sp.]|nr:hypothetical protein [Maritimibacter sp.]
MEPGTKPGDTAPDTGRGRDNGFEAAAARDIKALRREMERRDLPAGPPPTFEVSQLEIDTDFQQIIARVEAARAQAREADALKLEAETEERLAESEMARLADKGSETGMAGVPTSAVGIATGVASSAATSVASSAATGVAAAPAHQLDAQY